MKIDLFIPPAIDDIAWAAGYLIRCKPENDCASLFGQDTTPAMYSNLTLAFKDTFKHAKTCPHEHAVVVIARGPASVEGGCGCQSPRPDGQGASREPGKPSSTEPHVRRKMYPTAPYSGHSGVHDEKWFCRGNGCRQAWVRAQDSGGTGMPHAETPECPNTCTPVGA